MGLGYIPLQADCLPQISLIDNGYTEEGFIHADRCLDVHVLLYVERGKFVIWEEEKRYELPAGSLFFMEKGLRHYGVEKCEKNTGWYFVHFYLPDLQNETPVSAFQFSQYVEGSFGKNPSFYYKIPKLVHLTNEHMLIRRMKDLRKRFWSVHIEERRKVALLFYEWLLDLYQETQETASVDRKKKVVKEAMIYLDEHKYEAFQATDVAKESGLSYKHLNEIFKEVTGETMQKYHNKLRMETAMRLLMQTDQSITEISEVLGFAEPFYFSNVFKKFAKESPNAYRKRGNRT